MKWNFSPLSAWNRNPWANLFQSTLQNSCKVTHVQNQWSWVILKVGCWVHYILVQYLNVINTCRALCIWTGTNVHWFCNVSAPIAIGKNGFYISVLYFSSKRDKITQCGLHCVWVHIEIAIWILIKLDSFNWRTLLI